MSNDKFAATGYDPQEYALAQPVPKQHRDIPWWRQNPTLGAAGATLALVGGIIVGVSLPRPAPEACEQALSYSEQGLSQSAKGLGAMGNAVDGGYGAKLRAVEDLNGVTTELKRLTPLYQDAKKECLK